jgi:hypothetical protein
MNGSTRPPTLWARWNEKWRKTRALVLSSRVLGRWPDLDRFDLDWMDDRFLPE